jgi:preprotein translocase subunit SecD
VIIGVLIDIVVTVLLYRWLFVGSYTPSHKSGAERTTEFVI